MDDLLSFALNEAGLDELFLSNSNDGFHDGQPAAAATANGVAAGAADTAAQQQQQQPQLLLQQPDPPPQLPPEPKIIIVPRSAPPIPPSSAPPFGDLLAHAAAALNDDMDDDPLMMLSTAATSSTPRSAPPIQSTATAPAAAAAAPPTTTTTTARSPGSKTTPSPDRPPAPARAVGGAESTLRPAAVAAAAAAATPSHAAAEAIAPPPSSTPGSSSAEKDAPPQAPPPQLRPVPPKQQPLLSTPMGRAAAPGRVGTPESSTGTAVRRVLVGAGGQRTPAGTATPSAAAAAAASTATPATTASTATPATPGTPAANRPVTPAAPGQLVRKKVLLKRTVRGPNGPQMTQTHAIMTVNDQGEKNYYTIPSPGGTSTLITTVGAPGSTATSTVVRPVQQQQQPSAAAPSAPAAAAAAAAAPATQQQQQQEAAAEPADAGGGAASGSAPGAPATGAGKKKPPEAVPRRILVIRRPDGTHARMTPAYQSGQPIEGIWPLAAEKIRQDMERAARYEQGVASPSTRGGMVRRPMIGSASTGDLERLGAAAGARGGGAMSRTPNPMARGTVVRRVSAAGTPTTILRQGGTAGYGGVQRGGFVQRTSNLVEQRYGQGHGEGTMVRGVNRLAGRPPAYRGSASMRLLAGSGQLQQQQHAGSPAPPPATMAPGNAASYTTYQRSQYPRGGLHHHQQQHMGGHGHQFHGRGGSTMASHRMSRGGHYGTTPQGHQQQQPAGMRPMGRQQQPLQPQHHLLQTAQPVDMAAYSPMPRGLGGQDSSRQELDIRRRSMPPGPSQLAAGPSNGKASSSSSAASPALPKMAKTAKEEMQKAIQMAAARAQRNDIDEEEENLGHAETYAEYKPAKLRSGQPHPDSVVETASLSSVAPPDVRYQHHIPEYLIDTGGVSALQLEAVIYACQMHENILPSKERLGYLIGDGAGVGKGRTVACIIFENYLLGRRRALWLSVSNDLRFDAERDLRDIGAGNIQVHCLNKMKYSKISGKENGMVKKGVMFATYSSLIGECRTAKKKYQSRLKQLIQWLGVDFDGCIIFDECHRAKNLVPSTGAKPTKTGRMVLDLQMALPKARVVYASATGATEPRNMAYMTRLGLWGQGQAFSDFGKFIDAVERRGVGAMEIVAMDMKQRGLYLARQLSFRGVNFNIQEVQLSDAFVGVYDESVKLWVEVRRQFQTALAQMDEDDRATCKHIWGQFWASHQRFFKYLCIAAKVDACVKITREAIAAGKCVVIGLQSTGESRTLEAIDEMAGELTEFVSTAKAVLSSLIDKHYPTAGDFQTDIFRDFDRMFEGGEKRKRRGPARNDGMDVLEELGLGPSTSTGRRDRMGGPAAKRMKREGGSDDDNSTTSSSGDDSDEDDDLDGEDDGVDDEEDDDDDEAEEVALGENDDWLKALLAEAASSSEEEDGDDDSDDEKKIKKEEPDPVAGGGGGVTVTSTSREDEYEDDEGEDEFNPFACDFSRDDPWASKQQVVEDSPKKKRVDEDEEEKKKLLEERKRERRRLRKRKKRKLERKREKAAAEKKQREIASEAVKKTASDFMTSSRLCEADPDTFNPKMIKAELLAAVERLGPSLPANTLDQLIDDLGGPEFVAEMTGRKGRIVQREDGEVEYELRHTGADVPLELMNMDEKDKFMKGEKVIAIISEAASSGISLQSDKRAPNTRRRVHITLELPWSADKAIQQFGRTHRSNQVSAPEYIFLISELAGEKRFASIVAKRLESLGALTHGDRRATESRDLSQFNFDTKYGRQALEAMLKSVVGQYRPPIIPPPEDYRPGNFFQDMCVYLEGVGVVSVPRGVDPSSPTATYSIEKDGSSISKFLNRILGLPVHAQNALFAYFADILAELIQQAKHDGTFDMGIMDLGTGGDLVKKLETRQFAGKRENGSFRVELSKIGVERGVSWEDAHSIWKEHNTGEDGFYAMTVGTQKKRIVALVYGVGKKRLESGARLYAVTKPSTGRSAKLETFAELSKRFEKITDPDEAKVLWEEHYEGSSKQCQHAYAYGKCKHEASGIYCEVGRRTRTYFVLSGSVLSVWPVVEDVLSSGGRDRRSNRMQVIRVRTDNDLKIVGLLVLPHYVRTLISALEEHCGRCTVDTGDGDKKK